MADHAGSDSRPGAPPLGRGLVQDRASRRRKTSRLRAPGPSRSLGWTPIARSSVGTPSPADLRRELADRLLSMLAANETTDWCWFEDGLAYDNPRLSQAMIQTGLATRTPAYVEAACDRCAG